MKWIIVAAALSAPVALSTQAQAIGCLSGAVMGGVAGHYAGHHGLLGAAAGCAYGHHRAVQDKRMRRQQMMEQRGAR
jgi:outer membrane lipoprotein SlyB